MRRRPLFWQIFPPFIIMTLLAVAASAWLILYSARQFFLAEQAQELEARAIMFRTQVSSLNLEVDTARVDELSKRVGRESRTRITVVLASGKVIGDSDQDPAAMENHANRPEIQEALNGRFGVATRYSHTLFETMMYAAVPIIENGRVLGVVRAALPVTFIDEAFRPIYLRLMLGVLLVGVPAALASLYISRRIAGPLEKMRHAADHFTRGEFQHRLPAVSTSEIADLGQTMNDMAAQLDEKIRTVLDQRNERDAILSSMVEGVIAFDNSERVITLNQAAARMFSLDQDEVKNRLLQETFRDVNLQRFIGVVLSSGSIAEEEIRLEDNGAKVLRMHGTVLRDDRGQQLGAVVVLHDVTRLDQLERMRRDFVANVSHELRTPITSIKGFVETLRDGAAHSQEDTERFLDIISKQTDRLNTIINDLLTLSGLEQTNRSDIQFENVPMKEVLDSAIVICETKATAKDIHIDCQCDTGLRARVNPALLEQAIVNLIDNSIKYSDAGSKVAVAAALSGDELAISVTDYGLGIARMHLPRLFERFYRVDRARSRELGGTGLGLSIVKHIALAHGGRVDVVSSPGQGSTFTIYLPGSLQQQIS